MLTFRTRFLRDVMIISLMLSIRLFSFTVTSALSILNLLIKILRGSLQTMQEVLFLGTLLCPKQNYEKYQK